LEEQIIALCFEADFPCCRVEEMNRVGSNGIAVTLLYDGSAFTATRLYLKMQWEKEEI